MGSYRILGHFIRSDRDLRGSSLRDSGYLMALRGMIIQADVSELAATVAASVRSILCGQTSTIFAQMWLSFIEAALLLAYAIQTRR